MYNNIFVFATLCRGALRALQSNKVQGHHQDVHEGPGLTTAQPTFPLKGGSIPETGQMGVVDQRKGRRGSYKPRS